MKAVKVISVILTAVDHTLKFVVVLKSEVKLLPKYSLLILANCTNLCGTVPDLDRVPHSLYKVPNLEF